MCVCYTAVCIVNIIYKNVRNEKKKKNPFEKGYT